MTTRCSLQILRRQRLQRGDFDQITLGQDQQLGLDQLAPLLDRCVVGCADLEAWMISSRDGRQAPRGSWLLRAAEQKSPSDPHEHNGLNLSCLFSTLPAAVNQQLLMVLIEKTGS